MKSKLKKEYLQESNVTNTIADLFMKNNNTTNITWKYYYHKINADGDYRNATINGDAYDFWNPFAAKPLTSHH
jgi:hypothetical protein